ncbi:c-type cytochrome [Terricaulis sp.]|uniref:c-type cytochrome n=1 Tax=Terricaulis sp. TaxID=2768686 RepID=UPI0037850083
MSDNLRTNSIFGAVLASALGVMAIGVGAQALVQPNYPEKAGFVPEVAETPGGGPAAPAGPPDFGRLFSDQTVLADLVSRGERGAQVCTSCHTFEAGGANKTGPGLHDVFGREAHSHAGFSYSPAMSEHNVRWDYLTLNAFLTAPSREVRGTAMNFAGISNERDRVAVIAYLRSISPNNVPLPDPLPEAAPAEAPAGGEGAATTGAATTPPAPGH